MRRPPAARQTLARLPPHATTGIGSLPHTRLEPALEAAFALDIPFLPQLPVGRPAEFMIPQALEGLPGLRGDARGRCEVDLGAWAAGREAFEARLESALASGALESFEPSPEGCLAWRPFLREVAVRAPAFAKAQVAGPFTVRALTRTSEGQSAREVPALDAMLARLVLARARAMVRALRRAGTTPLFFLDEPGLSSAPGVASGWTRELETLVEALQDEGALVGVHCCGQAEWGHLLEAGLDVLSLDVRLSLDAVLEESGPLARWLGSGAALCLGLLPTRPVSPDELAILVDAVEVSLEAALPPGLCLEQVRLLLTPACGLALGTEEDAERILAQLSPARRQLQAAGAARRPVSGPAPAP